MDWVDQADVLRQPVGRLVSGRTSTTPPEFRGNQIVHTFNGSNSDSAMTDLGFPTVPTQFQQVSGYADNPTNRGTVRNIFTRAYFNANTTFSSR